MYSSVVQRFSCLTENPMVQVESLPGQSACSLSICLSPLLNWLINEYRRKSREGKLGVTWMLHWPSVLTKGNETEMGTVATCSCIASAPNFTLNLCESRLIIQHFIIWLISNSSICLYKYTINDIFLNIYTETFWG